MNNCCAVVCSKSCTLHGIVGRQHSDCERGEETTEETEGSCRNMSVRISTSASGHVRIV